MSPALCLIRATFTNTPKCEVPVEVGGHNGDGVEGAQFGEAAQVSPAPAIDVTFLVFDHLLLVRRLHIPVARSINFNRFFLFDISSPINNSRFHSDVEKGTPISSGREVKWDVRNYEKLTCEEHFQDNGPSP